MKKKLALKRTVKYLPHAPNAKALQAVLKGAPESVIKSLGDIALNAAKGDISLTPTEKRVFGQNRKRILDLASKGVSLKRKRTILTQKGGFAWIPMLVGSVLGIVGSRIVDKQVSGN